MKILYFFPEYDNPMFSWQRVHIIDELSKHGIEVETFNPLLCENSDIANEQFIKIMQKGKYDLMMSGACYPRMIYPEVLSAAKSLGIPTLCIRWDNLTIPFTDEEQAKKFDLVWLTAKETAYLYKKWGANYTVQPYAANPYTFKPVSNALTRKVCFIGTPYGSRSLMINTLSRNEVLTVAYFGGQSKKVKQFDVKYNLVSPSRNEVLLNRLRFKEGRKIMWGMIVNKFVKVQQIEKNDFIEFHPAVAPTELSALYSDYALSLASTSTNHTDALKNPLKIVNLRNFEIPMSGGIEICKYNPELAGYFKEGKEILFYRTNDELVSLAKHYTQRAADKEIRVIKEAARLRAENEHTWWCRFKKAFDILGVKYETE